MKRRKQPLTRLLHPDEKPWEATISSISLEPRAVPVESLAAVQKPEWSGKYQNVFFPYPPEDIAPAIPSVATVQDVLQSLSVGENLSFSARARKASDLARKFHVYCTVEMIVHSPPERHFASEEILFFEKALQDGSASEKKMYAKLLVACGVYPFFRLLDRVLTKTVKGNLAIFGETIPNDLFHLSEDWILQPPAVRKTLRFQLTPDLRWEVDHVDVNPTYFIKTVE